MFDVEKIKKYGQAIISLDGQSVYCEHQLSNDEEKTEARISSLLYEEAKIAHFIVGSASNLDGAIEEEINKYDLNHKGSSSTEAWIIAQILTSNGHIEFDLSDKKIASACHFLARTEGKRGLAILEYHAHREGFTMENFDIQKSGNKLILTFEKKYIDNNFLTRKTIFDMQGREKIEYAKKELATCLANKDETMSRYWQDIIDNLSSKLNAKNFVTTNEEEHSTNLSSNEKKPSSPSNEVDISLEDQTDYAQEQFKSAIADGREEEANFWQSVIDGLDNEPKVHIKEMLIRRQYKNFEEARRRGDPAILEVYRNDIRNELQKDTLSMRPEEWENMDTPLRIRYMEIKRIEADINNNPEEYTYWNKMLQKCEKELVLTVQENQ